MLPRIIYKKFALRYASRAERIGLDDVRSSLQKPAMDIANDVRLSQREQVTVIQQVLRRTLKRSPLMSASFMP